MQTRERAALKRTVTAPRLALAVAALVLSACAAPAPTAAPTRPGSDGASQTLSLEALQPVAARIARPPTMEATGSGPELAFARAILAELQILSFAQNREFCGYMGRDASGALIRTDFVPGVEAGCALPPVPPGMTVLASFHTHSTYSPLYASEFPTTQDIRADASLGIDGYISTPGGRLWFVDSDTLTAREICGRGCLPADPDYDPRDDGPLQPVMGFDYLLAVESGRI